MKKTLSLFLVMIVLASILYYSPISANATTATTTNSVDDLTNLRFDDRIDMTGKNVEIIDAGKPTSYQVGFGIEENSVLDTDVLTMQGDTLVATGVGAATVKIDDEIIEITVTPAPISLLLLVGQSNMQGNEGNVDQSIVCPEGQVYATYGDRYTMTIDNATNYAPSALTGSGSTVNVNGNTDDIKDFPVCLLNEAGPGKMGIDSGLAYEWVKQTGEKVWVINAAHGGTAIGVWQPGKTEYEECQALFTACQETLRKEIAAGHFTLSHKAYFWCQGCSDNTQTAQWYVNKFLTLHNAFNEELAFDHDSDATTKPKAFEFAGILPIRSGSQATPGKCYRDGIYTDTTTRPFYESFLDLRMVGPRVAQFWMCNNPELEDIWMVCNIAEDWVWMPDNTNGVAEYFQSHYPNGTVDYPTQTQQSNSWRKPTTPKDVHDTIHYNQIGYNELGRESARNALIMLGEIEAPQVETTVELVSWNGYTPVNSINAWTTGKVDTLIVPKISPVWKTKEVTYTLSDGLSYEYYDLVADDPLTEGTLTVNGANSASVCVTKQEPGSYYADHFSPLPKSICYENLWAELEHEKLYYSGDKSAWVEHSQPVHSVTIPVAPGDKLFATSFGKAGTNGHSTTNGICITYFGVYDNQIKNVSTANVYKEFTANGGYLVVPEGVVAVNIPMWNNSDENELYILNRRHQMANGVCTVCGLDSICVRTNGLDRLFSDLNDAIASAEAGSTIYLYADTTVEILTLEEGVTLDLLGHRLTVNEGAFIYANNNVCDSSNGNGILAVAQKQVQFPANHTALPIWNGSDGYIFIYPDTYREMHIASTENSTTYYFLPEISETVHQYLKSGRETSGVNLKIDISWTKDGQEYTLNNLTYTDAHLKQFYEGYANGSYAYAFRLTLTGTDLIDDNSLQVTLYYETERGVKVVCSATKQNAIHAKPSIEANPFQ